MADENPKLDLKVPWQTQLEFFRQKLNVPTAYWDDIMKEQHDRGFMVAGAMKADLLNDLRQAVDKCLAEGKTIGWFRSNFDAIVKEHGWAYYGERNWRTRVIYQTNMLSSYAAGRYAQMSDPKRLKQQPYWVYHHGHPVVPRQLHLDWDGLALPADDPWWQVHYPPNGWGCTCRASAASKAEIDKNPAWRLADQAPDDGVDVQKLPSGEVVTMPAGVDYGWDYPPGATVAEQLRAKVESLKQTLPGPLKKDFMADMARAPLMSSLAQIEAEIVKAPVETTVVLDADGKELLRNTGDANSVGFKPSELALLKDTVVTHNHTAVTSFSAEDVELLVKHGLQTLRAVDSQWAYTLERVPPALTAKEQADFLALAQDLEATGWGDYLSRLMRGDLTELEFNENFYHWIWSVLGQKTDLITYQRQKR